MDEPSTSKSWGKSNKQSELQRPNLKPSKQLLVDLIADGPIEMELLKKIAKECFLELSKWHLSGQCK